LNKLLPFLAFSIILVSLGTVLNAEAGGGGVNWTIPGDITVVSDVPPNVVFIVTAVPADRPGDGPIAGVTCVPSSGNLFPFGSTTVTCTVPDPDGRGSHSITFVVTVTSTGPPEPCPVNGEGTAGRFILSLFVPEMFRAYGGGDPIPCADLSITKSDNIDPVEVGTNLSYTITVTNNGPITTQGVVVTDTLPFDVSFVSTTGCDEDPNGVSTCSLGDIASGDSAQYTIEVSVDNPFGIITNTATVSSQTELINTDDDTATENTQPCIGNSQTQIDPPSLQLDFILSLLIPEQFRAYGGDIPPDLPPCSTGKSDQGGTAYPDPHLGDPTNRLDAGHDNGFCMNQNCINVRGYFNHFPETTVRQGSTQTFTLLVDCQRGANLCNHFEIAGALPDSKFYEYQWATTVDRQPGTDNWDLTVTNPFGEIGEVTVTVQKIDATFMTATFNVEFLIPGSIGTHDGIGDPQENNRHLHVTVWDSNGGMRNYIFNEGMYVDDIYAYPQIEESFDPVLEYDPLCLNENINKRYTCAFEKVRQGTVENAEKTLLEIHGSMIKNNVDESKSHDYDITPKSNDIELEDRLAYELERAKALFSDRFVVTDDDEFHKYWEIHKQFLEKNS